jgi:tetratricopeptide (TPR) repeat protein
MEAIKCYDQILALNPENSRISCSAYLNKGNSLDNLCRYEDAIECYEKAIDRDPNLVTGFLNKGLSLTNLGKYEDAIKCFDTVLQKDDRNIESYFNKANAWLYKF